MDRVCRLRHIKYILREYTKGLIPINQIAESCLNTKMPDETIHELGEKIYVRRKKGGEHRVQERVGM